MPGAGGWCATCCAVVGLLPVLLAFPESGIYEYTLTRDKNQLVLAKSLYKDSQIFIQITCESDPPTQVTVTWFLMKSVCWDYENIIQYERDNIDMPLQHNLYVVENGSLSEVRASKEAECRGHIVLDQVGGNRSADLAESVKRAGAHPKKDVDHPVRAVVRDGVYVLMLQVQQAGGGGQINASVRVEMLGSYGYLSAADWPLLPFYGGMCLVYVCLGLAWLLVSFLQWRDLLRIQFWIGGVILLGMLEKATFYAEYQSVNATGSSVAGAMLLAEWVSCAKRTLARMLVIIVSLGFGIVKPRLGPALHRVVAAGALYFCLAAVEAYLRVARRPGDRGKQLFIASIPLAVLDSAVCWWIFMSLVQTTRTLRLRRNAVKLALYKHFTNTLAFAVVASVVFMAYSIQAHKLAACLTDWRRLWLDEAYWHVLFSVLLLAIMVLWRPTNNNQRYAFTPLLDSPEDDGDDDDDDQFVSDAYGVKVRFHSGGRAASPRPKSSTSVEDDIRWVEEHIPAAMGDAPLPVLDSDEEIMNTKFEVSKMQ